LHFILMAMFMVVPGLLAEQRGYGSADLWVVYLPVILLSFVFMVPAVFYTETRRVHKTALDFAVAALVIVLVLMSTAVDSFYALVALLVGFFIAFNILEALQPSLVSRVAPPNFKGLALGFYNTSQSLGVFAGASLGGVVASQSTPGTVFLVAAALALVWFGTARGFRMDASPQAAKN